MSDRTYPSFAFSMARYFLLLPGWHLWEVHGLMEWERAGVCHGPLVHSYIPLTFVGKGMTSVSLRALSRQSAAASLDLRAWE